MGAAIECFLGRPGQLFPLPQHWLGPYHTGGGGGDWGLWQTPADPYQKAFRQRKSEILGTRDQKFAPCLRTGTLFWPLTHPPLPYPPQGELGYSAHEAMVWARYLGKDRNFALRFRTAQAQRQLLRCLSREHPCKPPRYRRMHDPFKIASGVQSSGPWDPWLPAVENS